MSELKAFRIIQGDTGGYGAPNYKCDTDGNRIEELSYACEVYDRLEADKVIEELKSDIADLRDDKKTTDAILNERNEEIAELNQKNDDSRYNIAVLRKEKSHQKYKRCLAIARWCFTKSNYHFVLARHGEDAKKNNRKSILYTKWHKRWLAIAEKFKPNSTAQ